MRLRYTFVLAIATLAVSLARPLGAQERNEMLAYYAVLSTPAGGLPMSPLGGDSLRRPNAEAMYARMNTKDGGINNFGLQFHSFSPRLRWTAVAGLGTCEECDGVVMLGVGAETVLARRATSAGTVAVGLQPALGAGLPIAGVDAGVAFSATARLPVSITTRGHRGTTVFAAPGIGAGKFTELSTRVDYKPMISAGVRFRDLWGFGLLLGAQQLLVRRSGTLVGLGISLSS